MTKKARVLKALKLAVFAGLLALSCAVFAQEEGDEENKPPETQKKVSVVGYPVLGRTPMTGWRFGAIGFLVFNSPGADSSAFSRPSNFQPVFIYTTENQILLAGDTFIFTPDGWALAIVPVYRREPNLFFGLGNATDKDDEEAYTGEGLQLRGSVLKSQDQKLFLGVSYDFRDFAVSNHDEEGVLRTRVVNGSDGGTALGLGPAVRFDSRNDVLYASKGSFLNLETFFFPNVGVNDFSYSLFRLDVRKYFALSDGSDRDVLGLQFLAEFTEGDDIPFYSLPFIGGENRMRGLQHLNRYLDRQAAYAQVEYRRRLFWRFGLTAYAAAGDVAPDVDAFEVADFKTVFGLGLRFRALADQNLNIRLDVGFSPQEQSAFYLTVREAF